MWQYRFLHRDLEHLLAADAQLAEEYRQFARRSLDSAQASYRGFVEAGVLRMSAAQIEALTINAWIILISWVQFLGAVGGASSTPLSQDLLRRGIFQVLALEQGFVATAAQQEVQCLLERLHVPLAFE